MKIILILVLTLLSGCADNIKGEPGKDGQPGQDATATAVIGLQRPKFRSSSTSTTKVVVPASTSQHSKILVNAAVYENASDVSVDLSISGKGGLDSTPVIKDSVYYLYGLPAESGTTFDLIASLNDPSLGPSGFQNWSYLGSFPIKTNKSEVALFSSDRGWLLAGNTIFSLAETGHTSFDPIIPLLPITAHAWVGMLKFEGPNYGREVYLAADPNGDTSCSVANLTSGGAEYVSCMVPILTASTIYVKQSDPTGANLITIIQTGWVEDPTEWP